MTDKKLNLTQSIYEYLPIIKKVFIEFYGEKYADIVEDRLDNALYIGYAFPKDIKRTLQSLYKEKTQELIQQFFQANNIENTEQNIKKYFQYNPNFEYYTLNKLHIFFSYLEKEEHSRFEEKSFLNVLKVISENNELEEGSEEYYKIIENLKKLESCYKRMLDEFKQFQSQYKSYSDYINSCEKLKEQIHKKYTDIFLNQIYEYLSEKDKNMLDNKGKYFYISNLECYGILTQSSYQMSALIDAFTSESEQKLEEKETSDFTKNNIMYDRIKYFKKIGIDLGDDYNNYINNPICKSKMPSREMADKIIQLRENIYQQEQEEYITSTTMYKEQLEEINQLGLLDNAIEYNYSSLTRCAS